MDVLFATGPIHVAAAFSSSFLRRTGQYTLPSCVFGHRPCIFDLCYQSPMQSTWWFESGLRRFYMNTSNTMMKGTWVPWSRLEVTRTLIGELGESDAHVAVPVSMGCRRKGTGSVWYLPTWHDDDHIEAIWESLVTPAILFSKFTSLALCQWSLSFKYYDVDRLRTSNRNSTAIVLLDLRRRFTAMFLPISHPRQCMRGSVVKFLCIVSGSNILHQRPCSMYSFQWAFSTCEWPLPSGAFEKVRQRVYEVRYARWLSWKLWRTLDALCLPSFICIILGISLPKPDSPLFVEGR